MKKCLSLLFAVVLAVSFTACGNTEEENKTTTEIDTGIPDVVMLVEDNLTETKDGININYTNKDGDTVIHRRYDGNEVLAFEKYISYCPDGRIYQELNKDYENGELYSTELIQFEYIQDSKDVVVTIWQKRGEIVGSDTITHTMTAKENEVYCNHIYSDWGEGYITLRIRGITEFRYGGKVAETEYIAGEVVKFTDKFA